VTSNDNNTLRDLPPIESVNVVVNPFREVNWQPGRIERRNFAVSLVIGFSCVAALVFVFQSWREGNGPFTVPLMVSVAGAAVGLVLWLVPQIARPFYVTWYGVACAIGFVTGNLALVAIYWLVLTPLGLGMRGLGRKSFSKRFDRAASSYWRTADVVTDPARYYRQF
jgi:hypothetical protein